MSSLGFWLTVALFLIGGDVLAAETAALVGLEWAKRFVRGV